MLRWARTHGPFVAATVARRYGLGRSVVESACDSWSGPGRWWPGPSSSPVGSTLDDGWDRRQYCHGQVLALVKRRTLALLRKEVEPVEQPAYARFLVDWQGVGGTGRGTDAVLAVIEQLSGYPLPASAVETLVLPARVATTPRPCWTS